MQFLTTVLANKSVLLPSSNGMAMRTGLRRIAGIHEDHFDPGPASFIHDLLLKLPEGPAVQTSTDLESGPDARENVRKVFKDDQAYSEPDSFCNSGFADFVVDVLHMSSLSAGSPPKCLLGAPGTIALETSPTAQVLVTVVLHLAGLEESAGRERGGIVFADVNAHDFI